MGRADCVLTGAVSPVGVRELSTIISRTDLQFQTIVTRPDVCFQVFQLAEFGVSSVCPKSRQVIGRFQLGRTRHINFVVKRCIQTQLGFCTLFLQFPYAIKNHRRTIKIPLALSAIRVEYVNCK